MSYAVDMDTDDEVDGDGDTTLPLRKPSGASQTKKRRLRRSSDSDDEYNPGEHDVAVAEADEEEDSRMEVDALDDSDGDAFGIGEEVVAKSAPKKKTTAKSKGKMLGLAYEPFAASNATPKKPPQVTATSPMVSPPAAVEPKAFCYEWMSPVRDKQGIKEGDPGYDPSTLWMPQKRVCKGQRVWMKRVDGVEKPLTAFEMQYWEIKSTMWDTILFFRKVR